jgi:hypothetical protein
MKNPEVCQVEYLGYNRPETPDELEFEIIGLQTAIYEIKKRIFSLKQSQKLVEMQLKEQ